MISVTKIIAIVVAVAAVVGVAVGLSVYFINRKDYSVHSFSSDFKFGAASASYQVEGAWNEDGKSPNIWDALLHKYPNYTVDGLNGDVSADSYHMYQKDVDALANVGVSAKALLLSYNSLNGSKPWIFSESLIRVRSEY